MMAAPRPPCRHAEPQAGCPVCRLAADPRYAPLLGRPAPAQAPEPCGRLGAPTGRTVECPSCSGRVRLKTFACGLHGECTLGKAAPGVACCQGCPDRVVASSQLSVVSSGSSQLTTDNYPPVTARDCLYHVHPLGGEAGPVWRQRLGMVVRRAALFDGRRVVAVTSGPGLETDAARRMAREGGFEVAVVANDPNLREAKTLLEVLPLLETTDPGRALFWGHAKGVTRPADVGNSCHPWAIVCHEACLDYWPAVEAQLRRHPITGPFKKRGRCFTGSLSRWHYSGTFWWARSADLFGRRPWREVEAKWFGAESTVGIWYDPEEAGCLFHEGNSSMDLYQPARLREALVEWAWWRAAHDHERTEASR